MKPLPVIIDCDPGLDDAINLFMAMAAEEELDILGITSVSGNVHLDLASRNACMIRTLAGRDDLPIYAGADKPWKRSIITAENVHGKTGLGSVAVFDAKRGLENKNATDFIIDTLMRAKDNSTCVITTGPLTNVASAIRKKSQIKGKIREIVMMGGAMKEAGNITPSAEYNIFADPHSADLIFKSGVTINVLGLDVTHQATGTTGLLKRLDALNSKVSNTVVEMISCLANHDNIRHQKTGPPLHDACTVAFVLKQDLFECKKCYLETETGSSLTMGHTSVDFWNVLANEPNVNWVHSVNKKGFEDFVFDQIKKY